MKKIGIKLADGTFFPILEEGSPEKKEINLTTVKDNQTKVKVDLYRGEKSSIDEAEYLDTLEISKMKKHPNGEPNIGLEISLDEKNELSAKIVDKESGAESQVSLSLLSENKNGPKNSGAENSDEAEGVALAPAADGEGTDMNAAVEMPTEEVAPAEIAEEIPEENIEENASAEIAEENVADDLPSLDELDLSLPEISEQDDGASAEEFAPDSALPDLDFPQDDSVETNLDETAVVASLPQNDDFSLDENFADVPPSEENIDENVSSETAEEIPEENIEENAPAEIAEDLPSLDELDLSLPEISEQDDGVSAEEFAQDSALPDLDFSQDDSAETNLDETAAAEEATQDSANDDLDFSDMDFELPNFDDTDFASDEFGSSSDGEKKSAAENSFDSFSESDSSSGALDFSDLYDDENEYGENPQDKNQKIPVVVCVVCAIICVLALLAILFVAPMRFNSSGENQTQDSAQEFPQDFSDERSVSELPPPPEPVAQIAPPAKEDEIVVITETKNVVPDFPPPQEKKSAPREIVYKIKWGDTLWDLSAAYYKNPWLYPKIARYNNIKNPDYIIAGSTIRIPEE